MADKSSPFPLGILGKIAGKYPIGGLLALFILLFTFLSPSFLSLGNLKSIIVQNTTVTIIAVGLIFIMQGGGIDLSLGYQISLVSVALGLLLASGINPWVAVGGAILLGLLCGTLNALVIIGLRIPPFAATLATQLVFKSFAYLLSRGRAYTQIPDTFQWLTDFTFLGIPSFVWISFACILLYGVVISFTSFGTYVKAIGENEEAVRRIGIKVDLVKFLSYVIGSFFFAVQAVILTYNQGLASPSSGDGLGIVGITAVFLSCDSSMRNRGFRFKGAIGHLILGILILAVVDDGILLSGWNLYIEYLVRGALLIYAVAFYYGGRFPALKREG